MGGDTGPKVVVPGAIDAIRARPGLKILLVGREEEIRPFLGDVDPVWVEIVHASENIEMNEAPAHAIRSKKDASISVALRLIREGRADAMVSAGNTGAVVAGS